MSYHGDIRLGDTIDLKFSSRAFATGAPTTLAGTPAVSAYPGNSTTQLTAGITLSVDFDGVTGLNNVRVVATSGNGYATATNYELVITTGTVGGVSVVGEVVGSFSIENRSALMPTTAAQTLDVSATGEAGVDWANVGGKTTANALTATTIAVTQKVDIDTIKTNPVVNAGTVTFPSGATLASTTNITAGTIATVTNLTNAPTAGDFTATMKTSIGTAVAASAVASVTGNVTGSIGSLAAQAKADVNAEADTALADVGVTTTVTGRIDAAITTRLASASYTAPLDASGVRGAVGLSSANLDTQLGAIAGYIDTEVGTLQTTATAIKAKTDSLAFTVAGQVDANIQYVNDTAITGDGHSGTEWGPA